MKHVLLVYSSQTGNTRAMADEICAGLAEAFAEEVELRRRRAPEAGLDDLLWADGLLIGTPENFGYMSGAVKDFFDRTYYPAEGRTTGLPYAIFVNAGNDGTGAVRAIERIATGYGWKPVAEPLISRGGVAPGARERAAELAQTLAAGLTMGLF